MGVFLEVIRTLLLSLSEHERERYIIMRMPRGAVVEVILPRGVRRRYCLLDKWATN